MEPDIKPLSARTKFTATSTVVLGALFCATGCTAADTPQDASSSETPATQASSNTLPGSEDVNAAYAAFDPALLTALTEKRNEETRQQSLHLVAEGTLNSEAGLEIPHSGGVQDRALLVAYMCRTEQGVSSVAWKLDFAREAIPLNSGIHSENCTENSVEIFSTSPLGTDAYPTTLEATGDAEFAVSIFEIEPAH